MQTKELLEELKALTVDERIERISKDVYARKNRYAALDMRELAELLGVYPGDGAYMVSQWMEAPEPEADYEDYDFCSYEEFLAGIVSAERLAQLEASEEVKLTPEEAKQVNEHLLSKLEPDYDCGWRVAVYVRKDKSGRDLCFRMCHGDGGYAFEISGPYASYAEEQEVHEEEEDDGISRSDAW